MVASGAASAKTAAKKKGKKRRVSKHIAESAKAKTDVSAVAVANSKNEGSSVAIIEADPKSASASTSSSTPSTAAATTPNKKRRKSSSHIKDPTDAAAYLALWQSKDGWKFNKNTQSWLIRHMYDSDKLSKATFATLLDYLNSAGDSIKDRILQEATRRALRYQQYSNNNNEKGADVSSSNEPNQKEIAAPAMESSTDDNGEIDEAKVWENLSDHDKRKEYKRARKTLDTLQAAVK